MAKIIPKSKNRNWSDFDLFNKKNFPEYDRRILWQRRQAKSCRFFYPFFSFLIPFLLFSIIAAILYFFRHTIISNLQPPSLPAMNESSLKWINELFLKWVAFSIFILGTIIALVSLIFGSLAALYKSREHVFQAENLEIHLRTLWALEKNKYRKEFITQKDDELDAEPEP